jgi:hypothetical protein
MPRSSWWIVPPGAGFCLFFAARRFVLDAILAPFLTINPT